MTTHSHLPAASVGDLPTHTDGAPAATAAFVPPAAGFNYELGEELGRGGMGVVYRARQTGLNRPAAVKMVLGGERAGPKDLIRFLAEAEAVASVQSPHVVRVYDYGQTDGRPYLAMEYCGGGTLADRLRAGKLAPADAADLLAQVADGVAAIHAAGIVHRDLKPGNVLFDDAGTPKVTDFGLAKRGAGADLTRTAAVMGTPAYMSPEQARGRAKFVGPPADVWALGVMLYEAVAGVRPFAGGDPWELLQAVAAAEPTGLRAAAPGTPRDLHLICHKSLAREPHERYATAAELAADLRAWRAGRPVAARPLGAARRAAKWVRRNQRVAGAAAAVFLAVTGGAGVATWQWRRAERALATSVEQELRSALHAATARSQVAQSRAHEDHQASISIIDDAIGEFERVRTMRPKWTEATAELASALVKRGECLQNARDYDDADAHQYIQQGIGHWQALVAEHPAVWEYRHQLAIALKHESGVRPVPLVPEKAERHLLVLSRRIGLVTDAKGWPVGRDGRVFLAGLYARRAETLRNLTREQQALQDCAAGLAALEGMDVTISDGISRQGIRHQEELKLMKALILVRTPDWKAGIEMVGAGQGVQSFLGGTHSRRMLPSERARLGALIARTTHPLKEEWASYCISELHQTFDDDKEYYWSIYSLLEEMTRSHDYNAVRGRPDFRRLVTDTQLRLDELTRRRGER